jgi:prevent-host-death family protein
MGVIIDPGGGWIVGTERVRLMKNRDERRCCSGTSAAGVRAHPLDSLRFDRSRSRGVQQEVLVLNCASIRVVPLYVLTYNCLMATRVIPKTELRDRIRQELSELGDDSLLITERGRPLAVVVSVGRWNGLQGQIEDLEDAVAILEHRSEKGGGQSIESVLSSIEIDESDVPGPTRKTG